MNVYVLDAKGHWWPAIAKAAAAAGFNSHHVDKWGGGEGYGFVRPSPNPAILPHHQNVYRQMSKDLTMVQDADHIDHYENKSLQFSLYADWMPRTWRFTELDPALAHLGNVDYPLVSKADEGSSSRNIRLLENRDKAEKHVRSAFNGGLEVDLGNGKKLQKGYVILQEFIPHRITYRVNAIGNAKAVFFRYCYPDRPMAQTGNVEPCEEITPEIESLLEWSDRFFAAAKTKWCAIDVLKDGDKWLLLETSLAWPWPSPGRCNEGPIFRSNHEWIGMFDVLMDEIKAGTFG